MSHNQPRKQRDTCAGCGKPIAAPRLDVCSLECCYVAGIKPPTPATKAANIRASFAFERMRGGSRPMTEQNSPVVREPVSR